MPVDIANRSTAPIEPMQYLYTPQQSIIVAKQADAVASCISSWEWPNQSSI